MKKKKSFMDALKQELRPQSDNLPAVPEQTDLQHLNQQAEKMQYMHNRFRDALQGQLGSLPAAIENKDFLSSRMYRLVNNRIQVNISSATNVVNAMRNHLDALRAMNEAHEAAFDSTTRIQNERELTAMQHEINKLQLQIKRKELEEPTPVDTGVDRQAIAQARLAFEPYRQRLLAIRYNISAIEEMIINYPPTPQELKDMCENILANAPETKTEKRPRPGQAPKPEPDPVQAQVEFAKKIAAARIELAKSLPPNEVEQVIADMRKEFRRQNMNRQE